MKKKREKFVDDGRVIASMNVDGMPWYMQKRPPQTPEVSAGAAGPPVQMTAREKRAFASGVLKAALLVTFVFIGAFFLFILFCVNIWFS